MMSNSSLVSYTRIAKHYAKGRKFKGVSYSVDRITPHCIVGLWTAKQCADYFATTDRSSSPNYGIGKNGDVSLCVDERNRSFCSSSGYNDARAITIECASDTKHPYAFPSATYNSLVDLCTDICKRYGKKKLIWFGDKMKTLEYNPKKDEMVLTVHRWFASKACPGDWLMARMGNLATDVTKRLNPVTPEPKKEDDEVIDKTKVLFNGKEVEVTRIIKDGVNFVKLRDLDSVLGLCKVDYDSGKKMPIINTK